MYICSYILHEWFDCPEEIDKWIWENETYYIDGLVQGCSNSTALAMEFLQPCTKTSLCYLGMSMLYFIAFAHKHNAIVIENISVVTHFVY